MTALVTWRASFRPLQSGALRSGLLAIFISICSCAQFRTAQVVKTRFWGRHVAQVFPACSLQSSCDSSTCKVSCLPSLTEGFRAFLRLHPSPRSQCIGARARSTDCACCQCACAIALVQRLDLFMRPLANEPDLRRCPQYPGQPDVFRSALRLIGDELHKMLVAGVGLMQDPGSLKLLPRDLVPLLPHDSCNCTCLPLQAVLHCVMTHPCQSCRGSAVILWSVPESVLILVQVGQLVQVAIALVEAVQYGLWQENSQHSWEHADRSFLQAAFEMFSNAATLRRVSSVLVEKKMVGPAIVVRHSTAFAPSQGKDG